VAHSLSLVRRYRAFDSDPRLEGVGDALKQMREQRTVGKVVMTLGA